MKWPFAIKIVSEISGWIIGPIILALVIGKKLDAVYQTGPWIFLGLVVLSFLISSFGIFNTVKKYIQK